MNVGQSSISSGSSYRNSKLTLTPLIIPPPAVPSNAETAVDHSTPALSLETPGRPGSARLAPLRNPPLAPPVVIDHPVNLPDVDRAPFAPQRVNAIDGSGSDSDDHITFAIDLKPTDRLSHSIDSQPASVGSPSTIGLSSTGIISAVLLAPIGQVSALASPSQPVLPDAHQPAIRPLTSSPGNSALDSGLSLRERQLLKLLSADEQGHLHSHALGSNSGFRGSSSNANTSNGFGLQSHAVNSKLEDRNVSSISASQSDLISAAAVTSLSRKGSDAHSDGSWDDDEAAAGANVAS
jgi:hypothetical protein